MKRKCVQLPPLPLDLPVEVIEMIWLFVRMPEQDQETVQEFLRESLKEDADTMDETEFVKMIHESQLEVNQDINEFVELMKKMTGEFLAQSCAIAVCVFQYYFIEKKSINEISRELNMEEEFIRMVVQCYDKGMDK